MFPSSRVIICGIRTIMTISNRGNDCYNVAALVIFTIHMLCSPGPSFNALIWRSTETSEIDEIMIISFPLFSGWRHHGFLIILCTQNSRLPLKLTDYNYKNRNWKEHIKPPSRKTANATTGWCKQLIRGNRMPYRISASNSHKRGMYHILKMRQFLDPF